KRQQQYKQPSRSQKQKPGFSADLQSAAANWLRRLSAAIAGGASLVGSDAALAEAARILGSIATNYCCSSPSDTVAIGNADAASLASIQILLERQLGPGVASSVHWRSVLDGVTKDESGTDIDTDDGGFGSPDCQRQQQLTRIRLLILAAAFRRPRLRPFVLASAIASTTTTAAMLSEPPRSELRLLAAAARWLFPSTSLAAKEDAEFKEVVEAVESFDAATALNRVAVDCQEHQETDDDSGADIDDSSDVAVDDGASDGCRRCRGLATEVAALRAEALERELRFHRRFEAFANELSGLEVVNRRLLADPALLLLPDCGLARLQEEIKSLRRGARFQASASERERLSQLLAAAERRSGQLVGQLESLTRAHDSCLRRLRRMRADRDLAAARAERLADRCRRLLQHRQLPVAHAGVHGYACCCQRPLPVSLPVPVQLPPPPPLPPHHHQQQQLQLSVSSGSSSLHGIDAVPVRERRISGGGGGGWQQHFRHLLPGRLSGKRKS
ncbi:hypothetical protein BOX15_Mlig025351g2, partial [Macrostomum lignano]